VLVEPRIPGERQSEELEYLVVDRLWLGEEVTAVRYVDAITAEQALKPRQLVGVLPAGHVCMVLVTVAQVTGMRAASPSRRCCSKAIACSNDSVSKPLARSCVKAE
jgi:hypothetical protein